MSAAPAAVEGARLEVRGLTKHFPVGGGVFSRERIRAVDDVSFSLRPGRVTALVGESGSGKSTVARLLLRLYEPTAGSVVLDGRDLAAARGRREVLGYRSRVQMVFQDPFGSLNPVRTVHHHIARPLAIHHVVARDRVDERVHELLDLVGLTPPAKIAAKYPHELSGGQRQRVAIARALAAEPAVLIADEPTSMLDVSIRIGILNLILELKETRGLAFLYVTHDLASARYVADDVLVMYAGQIVEEGPIDDVLERPQHPYTRVLLSAVPGVEGAAARIRPAGERRPGAETAAACRFLPRCPLAVEVCSHVPPELAPAGRGQRARCHVTAPLPASREEANVRPAE